MLQFYTDKRDSERESSTGYYHLVNRTGSPQDEREGEGGGVCVCVCVWGGGGGGGECIRIIHVHTLQRFLINLDGPTQRNTASNTARLQ